VSALRAVWRVLASVPGIVYVAALVVALTAAAVAGIYDHGKAVGEASVHRKALTDSVVKESLAHRVAVQQTDRTIAVAHTATRMADTNRTRRARLREAVVGALDSLPAPVVKLIEADDALIRSDSIALVAAAHVETDFLAERGVAAELDTLRQHQVALGPKPSKSRAALWFTGGFVAAVVLTFAVAAAR
jgi:hypothetical protein